MDIVIIKDVDDSVVLESANNFEAQIQQRYGYFTTDKHTVFIFFGKQKF